VISPYGAPRHYTWHCTVVGVTTTAPDRLDALARVGRALADPTRCRIMLALLDGPAYPADLAAGLGLSRANTSNHLTCLRGCGLVVAEPQGRQVRYELANPALRHALTDLAGVVLAIDAAAACVDTHDAAVVGS